MVANIYHWIFQLMPFAVGPGSGAGESAGAGSPFTDYTASVAIYAFFIGVIVTVLLVGALFIINVGLMSKREEDRVGGRTPSDVGFLKENVWPEVPYVGYQLPAEEEDYIEEKKVPKHAA